VLSTEKAAYPINAMGISKALMEKVAIAKGRELGQGAKTTICCTRYGNVMASRGSVIPLWVQQMEEGKPITITDPNMTRFMMTLDDAVDLVIYAFTHGENGDLFVQKAPAATLDVLAEALKQTYAKVNPKYGETEVRVIGTRHGEKLYETLVTREEMAKAIDMGDYYRIPCDTRDLNYDKFFIDGNEEMSKIEDYHSHNTRRLDVEGMKELLLKLRFIREDLGLIEKTQAKEIRSE
jgi:UDP-glucose 4-epimerase